MLTDSQKRQVGEWVGEGLSLAQIQTKISEEFGVAMTYMDVRFLVDDLNLELQDAPEPEKKNPTAPAADESVPADAPAPAEDTAADTQVPADGGVSLSVDAVQMPGVLASGDVAFSDGARGKWFYDARGLGLDGFPQGYRPPQADIADFQRKLVTELRKLGLA